MNPNHTFDILFKEHFSKIYAYFSVCFGKESAEDLSQQVFLKLWNQLIQPNFTQPDSWKAWLFSVAVNVKNDFLRQKYRHGDNLEYDDMQDVPHDQNEEALLKSIQINQALVNLKMEEKELLLLKHNGFTSAEIGRLLGLSDSAVRSRYSTAKKHFKQRLQEGGIL